MGELCLIKRERCYLTVEFTALCHWQTLTSGKSTTVCCAVARSSADIYPACFAYDCRVSALKRGSCALMKRSSLPWRGFTVAPARFAFTLGTLGRRHVSGREPGRRKGASERCTTHKLGFIVFIGPWVQSSRWALNHPERIMEVLLRHVAEYFQPRVKVWECCATRTCVWSFYFPVRRVKIVRTQMQMKRSQFSTSRHMESNFIIIFMGENVTFLSMLTPAEKALLSPTASHY